ncbi:MAG TPA: cell wall-binding repeat-containing protein [Solirubrobacterales bacterium]|nr:cell wall-binding repeat-containing protein [Solirubrobacterales bacterium]
MSGERPINADVPAPGKPGEIPVTAASDKTAKPVPGPQPKPPAAKPEPKPPKPRRRRKPVPGALKLILATVLLAIAFIVVAVLGGSGGSESASTSAGPAPALPAPSGKSGQAPATQTAEQLGYPAFATNNTTRVGGSDPAANAAGVALAVYPSTTPAQQPAAVTLVGENDWAGAIAASALMAAPIRAPILISGSDGLPDPTAEALDALDPQGDSSTAGAGAFAIGDVATPDGAKVTHIKGGEAAATGAAVAKLRDRLFSSAPQAVIVAPADRPEFAMPAAAWAARSGDPVLYANGSRLPKPTQAALRRHTGVPAYVLGPSSAISSAVVREIAKVVHSVHRVSGEDPVANAVAFARYVNGGFGWNVNDPGHGFVLARSDSPIDAAVAAPLSASGTWGPLLLTDSAATLPKALREYFLDVKPGYTTNPTRAFYNHVWVIGDQEAIDVNQQAEVNELAELAKIGGGEP